ncbi:GntR family transcriptional regulator [Adhaeretor mobilis]|nr:GntR family transcriptional regulator [Adhaeretor mobilis]
MQLSNTKPKIVRVRDYVLGELANGSLSDGDALPSVSELAKKLEVGAHSVREAIGELDRSGIVQRIQGKGTFVSQQRGADADPGKKLSVYALVLPEKILSGLYPSVIRGFGQEARASRREPLMAETQGDLGAQGDVMLRLLSRKVSGVAIVPAYEPMPDHQLEVLQEHNIPVVFCHRHTARLDAPLVTWSGEQVGRIAAETLADLGHTRIALLSSALCDPVPDYVQGMRSELSSRGIAFSDQQVVVGKKTLHHSTEQDWKELLSFVLDAPDRATAVFCADDFISEHLYLAAMDRRIRVPEDLTIVGFGPKWRDGAMRNRLAAVCIDEVELGCQTVRLLNEMQKGIRPINSNEVVTMPLGLFEGSSLGPPAP